MQCNVDVKNFMYIQNRQMKFEEMYVLSLNLMKSHWVTLVMPIVIAFYRQVLGKRKLKGDVYILCGLISWRVMNFVSKHMIVRYSSMDWRTLSHAGPKLLHISKRRKSKLIFCLQRCHSYLCISSAHLINYSRFIG